MSFSLDTRNTKYLHNYEAALRHYDSITPLRGNTNVRPIAERRKTHFNIRKDERAGTLIVRLHQTDVITYHPDNRITLDMGGWNSVSTRAAIHAVTGVNIFSSFGRAWVRDHDGKEYPFKNNLQLQTGGSYRDHKIIDPTYPETHTLNRKELNQKLRQFRDYYNYLLGVTKVGGWRGAGQIKFDYSAMTNPDNYKDGVFAPEPEAAFALGMAILGNETFSDRNNYWKFFVELHPGSGFRGTAMEKIVANALKRAVVKAHKETLLTKTTITDGRIVKDNYAWAL
jgi:hypothetical protein